MIACPGRLDFRRAGFSLLAESQLFPAQNLVTLAAGPILAVPQAKSTGQG